MSRIGNAPISVPEGVEVNIAENNVVTVKGPKGELTQAVDPNITVEMEDDVINLKRHTDQNDHKSKHGLYRSLINNMITGVSDGYTLKLELHGVGYRAKAQGQVLNLSLGFSHQIAFQLPDEVKVTAEQSKGQPPIVTLESFDKQLIGTVAAKLRSLRPPEPYKGKGIRFLGEHIRRKAGKTVA